MSEAAGLEELLAQLRGMKPGTTLDEALAQIRPPEPADVIETRRRCAMVRAFDNDVYAELTRDLPEAPTLENFVTGNDVRKQGPQRWTFDESTRNALLRAWKLNDTDFRNWNGRLAKFFLERNRPEERLDALFHLAASPQPDDGAEYFEKWYAEADKNFDLAHCNALLEILRVREATRGTKLTRAWNDHRQFYQARQFFGDDYFKTGAYFERDGPLEKFEQLLKDGSKQWIYHVHATGGTGKTMFLRWLAARYLVPRHIPCARIDFDDFPLSGVLEYPNRIFTRIIDQLASQVPGGVLTALREKLQRELESPGWNSNVPEEIGRQLRGANLQTNLVVMLDTLEDVTRTAKVWLKTCLQTLRRLHELHPKLVVVLSGRYDISVHTNALLPGEAVVYELMRFSEPEADAYLAKRGIPEGDARTALVERAGENAELDDDKLAGRNPFKLAMFAELALNKTGLTAEMVRQLPRVDIAYLIQRVIMRISSQPLRWAVRYGVVVRHLNKAVVDAVLLPALKEALRGKTADDPNAELGEFGKVWEPDPALAETVTTNDIWNDLKTYVRERGWISLSGSEADGTEELRFHPDVVTPTRALLRDQTIYRDLQRHAAEFFHANSGLDNAQVPSDADAAVRNACEAVFHRFQVDGPAARDYWHANVRKIEGWFGLDSAVRYAGEICGPAFALAQVDPIAPFMNAAVLREAHCEAADLLLQTIAHKAIESGAEFTQFQLHVEWAKAVAAKHGLPAVPKFLVAIHDAASAKTGRALEMLEEARKQTLDPRERLFLTLVLARRVRGESPQDSARYLEQALPDLSRAHRVWVQTYSLAFELLRLYQSLGDHAGVMRALDTVRGAAGQQRIFLDPVDQAAAGYSLEIGDLETAAACIERLKSNSVLPRRSAVTDLEAQLALERGEVLKVITLAREGLAGMADLTDAEGVRADFHALQGVAHKHLLAYAVAFDCLERAGVVFDEAGSADGAARSTLLAAQLTALDLANIHDALSLVEGAAQLRGARDGELYVEFQLLRAYAAYRGGSLDAARELMPELRRRCAGQHPRLRARVAMFELCFGLETQERRHLELLAAVQAVEPRSARMKLLDLCGYSEASLNLTPKVRQRLQELFELAAPDSSIHVCLGRAHLFRLMGEPDSAVAVLRGFLGKPAAKDANSFFVCHWLIQHALRQLGKSTDYRSLLKPMSLVIPKADGLLDAWWDALHVECALEEVRAGDYATAASIASQREPFAALAGQMQPLWLSRIEEVQFYALKLQPPGSHAAETAERFEAMGDLVMARRIIEEWRPFASQPQMAGAEPPEAPESPPRMAAPMPSAPLSPPGAPLKMSEPPSFGVPNERPHGSLPTPEPVSESLPSDSRAEAVIQIGTGGLPDLAKEALKSNENAIDILLGRWKELADQLSDRLGRDMDTVPATLAFEVAPQAASLPWELAPFIGRCRCYWRSNAHARAPAMRRDSRVDRVLLVRPRQGSGDISLESASGGSLESLYTFRNRPPDFHVLFDPDPEMLMDALRRLQPTILHINAVMRELQGGIFLDFESTESRADERGARHGGSMKYAQSASVASQRRELVWSTTRLGRTLQAAPEPLTLVLDIAASSNLTETIRMLLLRNQFANQVFQFAPMCALLGVGLVAESERFDVSRAMIDGLLARGAFGAIHALRVFPIGEGTLDLVHALPRFAPALWAHDAYAGVFAS